MKPEVWLRGPVDGVLPYVTPVTHALLQAREDLEREVPDLTPTELWLRPGGAASMGFHVRHIGGSIERLLTYARGGSLSEVQRRAIAREAEPGEPPAEAAELMAAALAVIDGALETLRTLSGKEIIRSTCSAAPCSWHSLACCRSLRASGEARIL